MEKTSLALRLERIALEIGSQIDTKYQNKMARKATRIGLESYKNRFRKPREWEGKATRMGAQNHENRNAKKHENGNAKGRESLRIGTKKMPCFQRFTRSTGL